MKRLYSIIVVAVLVAWNSPVVALTIGDINLSAFDFDVVNYDVGSSSNGLGGDATASGTSNGVGWAISPTNLWSGRTRTNGSFSFSSLPNSTDNLHPAIDFTITFDQMVDDLLVSLSNDNTSDSINFGFAPTDVSGNVSVTGTQIVLTNPSGGLALFENINSFTVSHTNTNFLDGFDLAFHVVSTVSTPVPEPSTMLLLGTGLIGLVGYNYKRKKQTT